MDSTLSDEDKKEKTDYDEGNDTMAFNVVVDVKDTLVHDTEGCGDDEESLYSNEEDEEVSFKELQEK